MQKEFSDQQRATMGNIQSLLAGISGGILILVFGILADIWSLRTAIAASVVLDLAVAVCYRKLFRKYNNKP